MAKVLKADFGSGPSDAYVQFDHPSTTNDFYLSVDVLIPQDTFDANLTDEWLGAFVAMFGPSVGTERQDIQINYFSDWSWDQGFTDSYPGPQGITGDTWHTIQMHISLSGAGSIDWKVDGVSEGTSTCVGSTSYKRWRFGLLYGNGDVTSDNFIYLDNIKIGTSGFGSSEIFSDDFEDGTLDAWGATSGDVSVVDTPTFGPPPANLRVLLGQSHPIVKRRTSVYFDNVKVGSTLGGSDYIDNDFESGF
jgi:hypothetical protein